TAISDLEVEPIETKGHLWHLRYPIEGGNGAYIVVATTRPETMLDDTAVAVHPDDRRYQHLVGKNVILPLVGRRIPIIADEYSDPEKGSGAVKITPAHDFNDFEVGKRHDLPMVNIMGPEGKLLLDPNPDFTRGVEPSAELKSTILEFNGVFRFAARKMIAAKLEALGLMEKIEPHTHVVPHGDRSSAVIEPRLTDQWYVDAKTLARPAIDAVNRGRTTFVPKTWETTYFHWMENIQPWCISRQLWWGHQIPAWYGPDGKVFVAEDEEGASALAKEHYGKDVLLKRDEDVLDTWFSSALWPFSTLGWPDTTPELARYYPTDVLVTGFDIIFFWVARMMMMGLHFMEEVPFRDVYIHALVRDEKGQKMSKSKGNVIDPLELIDKYGADALRFTLAAMAAQGRDIKLSHGRVEGYRNFATKLWNAARFTQINGCRPRSDFAPGSAKLTVNRWIAGESERTAAAVTEALESFRFNEAAGAIYHFIWHVYCDWYLELIKPILSGGDDKATAETRAMAAFVLDRALLLLHPFMPFVTEELWAKLAEEVSARGSLLMLAPWPGQAGLENAQADAEIGWLIRFITDVRSVRAEMNVPAGAKVPLTIAGAIDETKARVARHQETLMRLARLDKIDYGRPQAGAVQIVLEEATLALPLAGIIDIDAEQKRLKREIDKVGSEIRQIDAKLGNEKFVSRAPEHVVEEQRERRSEAEATAAKLEQALKRLEAAL
ncbi:MAG: valine--tRNA ligase, partial [Actinomycetota bacterium]